jgi:hypothetical protein
MNFSWFFPDIRNSRIFSWLRRRKPSSSFDTFGKYNTRPLNDEEYNLKKAERQKVIDAILDKISKSGYESLTKEEKEILFQSGGKNP